MIINDLWERGKPVTAQDCVDTYTTFAYLYQLENYRIFTLESLMKSPPIIKGRDVPDYIFELIAEDKVLGIANMVDGQALTIIFRSLKDKKFLTYGVKRSIPYGLGVISNDFLFGTPILLVEGLKDRDAISTIYPYTVATQTAGVGLVQAEILKTCTNRLILAFDDDEAGRKGIKREIRKLGNYFDIQVMSHPSGVKDCGTIADYEVSGELYDREFLMDYYRTQLEALLGPELRHLLR